MAVTITFIYSITFTRLLGWKLLGLFIGCCAKFVTGSLFVFAVYQDAVKDTFNYTQKEVELMSSMLNIGLGVGFLPGMFYDRFGPQWTSAVGLLVSVLAYMLIWSTTKSVPFYRDNSWLMAIYFFICGLGSVFTYMVALNTNVINFDKKHTGKVIGLLNAFFAGSPSVFSALYYHVYSHGDTKLPENQDYPAFMLTFAICFAVVDILCIAFLRIYNDDANAYSTVEDEVNTADDVKPTRPALQRNRYDSPYDAEDVKNIESLARGTSSGRVDPSSMDNSTETSLPLLKLLVNLDYHLLVWTLALASSVGLVFVNNITTISKSLSLDGYDDRLTLIIPITNAVVSFSVGILSDVFKQWLPRMWIVIGACCCFVVSQLLALFFAAKIAFLMTATTFAGVGIGVLWSLAPTIMKELFYVGNLGRNWGIAICVSSLLGFSIQESFGFMYDNHLTDKSSQFCIGMKCVKGGIALCTAIACMSVVWGLVFQFKRRCNRRCTRPV